MRILEPKSMKVFKMTASVITTEVTTTEVQDNSSGR